MKTVCSGTKYFKQSKEKYSGPCRKKRCERTQNSSRTSHPSPRHCI